MIRLHHDILKAVLLDGKEIFLTLPTATRKHFDDFFKEVSRCDYLDLYPLWKQINSDLVKGTLVRVPFTSLYASTPSQVRWIRQVFGIFSRLEGQCDPEVAIDSWAHRCSSIRSAIPWDDAMIVRLARGYAARWLGVCPSIWDLKPKHGPGSVATGEKGANKRHFSATYQSIHHYLLRENPSSVVADQMLYHLNFQHMVHEPQEISLHKHAITKVVAVPKDITKPRIISCEPLSMQYLQQGLLRHMVRHIELVTPCIRFSTQQPNRDAARNLDNATLDMSDASDMISRRLVRQVMPDSWLPLLFALRSTFARLPSGGVVPLRCYAPMGSALCFPVEAVVFAAITCAHLEWCGHANPEEAVHVFGDDIIVPNRYAEGLIALLKRCGMVPNVAKCCFGATSRFRESCGAEWYDGFDVTVVRPRSFDAGKTGSSAAACLPMVQHANRLLNSGFPKTAQRVADCVRFPVAIGYGEAYASPDLRWNVQGEVRMHTGWQTLVQRSTRVKALDLPCSEDDYAMLQMHLVGGWASDASFTTRTQICYGWLPYQGSQILDASAMHLLHAMSGRDYGALSKAEGKRHRR